MPAEITNLTTADGFRIYDLDVNAADLVAVAGPEGWDPETIDPDDLPDGFRWIDEEEWSDAMQRSADIIDLKLVANALEFANSLFDRQGFQEDRGLSWTDTDREFIQSGAAAARTLLRTANRRGLATSAKELGIK